MKGFLNWFKATGITNAAYLIAGIIAITMGYNVVAGACFGIFAYVNFNVVRKLISDSSTEDIQEE